MNPHAGFKAHIIPTCYSPVFLVKQFLNNIKSGATCQLKEEKADRPDISISYQTHVSDI